MVRFMFPKKGLIASGLISLGILASGAWTQVVFAQYTPPPNTGIPGRRVGGGVRGGCSVTSPQTLTAVVPENAYGQTLDEYPTFWFYLPEMEAEAAEFMLLDESGESVYEIEFEVTGESGIIQVEIPAHSGVPPLAVGESYEWSLAMVCDRLDRSGDLFVVGSVERVAPDANLEQALAASPMDQSTVYAQAGLWYEAIEALVEQRQGSTLPADALTKWQTLLQDVGLEDLADEPFLF